MRLFAGGIIALVCFTMLSVKAQTTTAPKKNTAGSKADTSFKAKMFKLSDEFDYFGKTSTGIGKIDSTLNLTFDEFLKQLDSLDLTHGWKSQNGSKDIFVTTTSPLSNTDHYDAFVLAPRQAKTLHLNITGSLFSSNTFNPAYVPFYLQVKNTKTIFVNELVQGKTTLNISLPTDDSVAIFFIAHPPENDKAHFHCDWSIGDTAAYSYAGQKPEIIFDKMLELAPNQFTNIHNDTRGEAADIIYPDGLFAPLPAQRVAFYTHVTQYTGKKLPNSKAADLMTAEWNKKIKGWLKDYAVTDVKKTESGDRKLNTYSEITTYTKRDEAGKFLFSVNVFKEQEGDGQEGETVWWNTGVSIY